MDRELENTLGRISGCICLPVESKVSYGRQFSKIKISFVYTVHGVLLNLWVAVLALAGTFFFLGGGGGFILTYELP